MFRIFLTVAVLLSGCGSERTIESHIVEMPEPTIREVVREPNYPRMYKQGEPPIDITFKVFNQKNQFLYVKFYPAAEKVLFKGQSIELIDGHKLVQKLRGKYSEEFLTIHKLGSLTPDEFLKGYIGEKTFKNPRCFLEKEEPHIWYLNVRPSKATVTGGNMQSTKAAICGVHSEDWHSAPTTFFVKDGIVIIVTGSAEAYGLDMSSITFENRS